MTRETGTTDTTAAGTLYAVAVPDPDRGPAAITLYIHGAEISDPYGSPGVTWDYSTELPVPCGLVSTSWPRLPRDLADRGIELVAPDGTARAHGSILAVRQHRPL